MFLTIRFGIFRAKLFTYRNKNFFFCLTRHFLVPNCKYTSNHAIRIPKTTIHKEDVKHLHKCSELYVSKVSSRDNFTESLENSKEISKGEEFIKVIKSQKELNEDGLVNILNYFRRVKRNHLRTMKVKQEIKSSEEFSRITKALHENALKVGTENLINCISFYCWFNLPKNNFFLSLISAVIEKLDDITFQNAVLLFDLLNTFDHDLKNQLIEDLKFKIENEIVERGNNLSSSELISALRYAGLEDCSYWSDKFLMILFNSALGNSDILGEPHMFENCYALIHHLKDENTRDASREKLFKKIYEVMLEENKKLCFYSLCIFINKYSHYVLKEKEDFDERLFNDVIDFCMSMDRKSLMPLLRLISAMKLCSYPKMNVVKIAMNLSKNCKPSTFANEEHYLFFLDDCIEILSWVYKTKMISEEQSYFIYLTSNNLPILNDISVWENIPISSTLRLAISLASLRIFPHGPLEFLKRKINEIDIEEMDTHISYMFLILKQAVTVLQETSSEPFLNEEMSSRVFSRVYGNEDLIPQDYKLFRQDITQTLELILPRKTCLCAGKLTKLWHNVSFMVAVNEKNEFLDFRSEHGKFIEEISTPENYKKMIILPLTSQQYTRKFFLLKSAAKIRIDTLHRLTGCTVLPILQDVWVNLSKENKEKYIRNILLRKSKKI